MKPAFFLAAALVLSGVLAGCLSGDEDTPPPGDDQDDALNIVDGFLVGESVGEEYALEFKAASGQISQIQVYSLVDGAFEDYTDPVTVTVPDNVFLLDGDAFAAAKEQTIEGPSMSEPVRVLVPPGMENLTLRINGEQHVVPTPDTDHHLFDGHNIVEWYKVQRDEYPNRCNGCPNYAAAQDYFAGLFEAFGMAEVEVDPYGTNPVHAEFANVVAYKYPKLGVDHPTWLGVGGHYDVVGGTTEGAFDNTAGTLATLELARVFGQFDTNHNLVFGLWGGEEAGLQGSNFFAKTNPNVVAQMDTYVNLDVSAFSWPAPLPIAADGSRDVTCDAPQPKSGDDAEYCQDPVVISAGPDGPAGDDLLALGRTIQSEIMVGYPDPFFLYEYVGEGQVEGYAGVNAQSDHTSFIAAGVPSYFLFNGNALNNPIGIHNQRDTIDNWTKYMVHNFPLDLESELTPEQQAAGETLAAQSFETYLWFTFYVLLHHDLDLAPGPAAVPDEAHNA